jgi:periplasmic copper chaperone A
MMSRREMLQLQVQALAAIVLLAASATIHPAKAQSTDNLRVVDAYIRSSGSAAQAAAAFMTLNNTGSAADRLLSASTPVAGTVELHTHIKEGDVMRMRAVPAIDLPAGQSVTLQPGGLHVMLMGLRRPLAPGESVDVTLVFEKGGSRTVSMPVRALNPGGAPAHKH